MTAVVARLTALIVSLLQLITPVASSHSDAVVDASPRAVDAPVTGTASWYRWRSGQAAAGPALRVGNWRGRVVDVCASRCVRVVLTDWCACPGDRVVDLDSRSFAVLAPLSRGLVRVTVSSVSSFGPEPTLPPTDRN